MPVMGRIEAELVQGSALITRGRPFGRGIRATCARLGYWATSHKVPLLAEILPDGVSVGFYKQF